MKDLYEFQPERIPTSSGQIQMYLKINNCGCTIGKYNGAWYAINYFYKYYYITRTLGFLTLEDWLIACKKIEYEHPTYYKNSADYNIEVDIIEYLRSATFKQIQDLHEYILNYNYNDIN